MSPIDICNQALAHVGDRSITRLDEEAQAFDPLVGYCARFYDLSRRQVMASHRWSFAKGSAVLSRRVGAVCFGYLYAHVMPTDKVRVLSLHPGTVVSSSSDPVYSERTIDKFKIVGRDVWSNHVLVGLHYIRDITDPSEWTPHFAAAVSRLMAHYLAGAIGADPRLASAQLDTYERVSLPNAQFYDSVQDESGENARDRRSDSPTLLARRTSAWPVNDFDD